MSALPSDSIFASLSDKGTPEPLWKESVPTTQVSFPFLEGGGVTSAQGFLAAGMHAGFRKNPQRFDFALVVADQPSACAATFTQNVFCAAPVQVSRKHLLASGDGSAACGVARAVVINSGNANAATGERGIQAACETAHLVADVVGCPDEEVMVASTGVIGEHLPLAPFEKSVPRIYAQLSRDGGTDAACAIMTTDTHPKECACTFSGDNLGYPGVVFTVGGMAKGSGMIMPYMATMIAVITTDAPLLPSTLHDALKSVVAKSFNKVTVDSDTSTNDSCFLLASGAAAPQAPPFEQGSPAYQAFEGALMQVCSTLARAMAADGEGATRLLTVRVVNAATEEDADMAARAVANSPLVKTAVYGHDANWGRIAMALGKSGARFEQEKVAIDIMGLPVCRDGLTVAFDEEEALVRFERPEIEIDVDLGEGHASTTVWSCDFSHEYVTINGDYRT